MPGKSQNTIIGIFALVGIAVLCALVFVFGGGSGAFKTTYLVSVHFEGGVEGVQEGQRVTMYGKRIGQTQAVEFYDPDDLGRGVNVVLAVDKQFEIPSNTEVQVMQNVMGIGRPNIQLKIRERNGPAKLPRDGTARLIRRRETYQDMIATDVV